ncbi:hypothetical protein BaRGS_00002764 [Batillaria attramentaria]|uniref:Uncharacterized protein n=1 Tax=Batillaria attramentaria TaxID=370345 RepID=A0ABD0M2W6_9CAEN
MMMDDSARVVRFITNYAEDHGVSLPGHVPGFNSRERTCMYASCLPLHPRVLCAASTLRMLQALVEEERKLYRDMTSDAKEAAQRHTIAELGANPANTKDLRMHYSFDFAQQVHYPNDAAQPGPLYFLTPRKCGIFGIHCEGLSQQVNYLIDESVSSSKGSNAVQAIFSKWPAVQSPSSKCHNF